MTIKFKKLSEKAVQPVRTTDSGAGYNLTAVGITTEVNERGQLILVYHTGIGVEVPEKYEGVIRPNNNLNSKTLRMIDAPCAISGNIDDEIVAKFVTTTDVIPAVYKEGEHIAQLVFNKIENTEFVEIIDTTKHSADEGDQSLPENEDASTNSDESNQSSGGEENIPEEA